MLKHVGVVALIYVLFATPSLAQVGMFAPPTTGHDLRSDAQTIVDTASAQNAFEALSDTRFRLVRHRASGFVCSFAPSSNASVLVLPNTEIVTNSGQCTEVQQDAVIMQFRLVQAPNGDFDAFFQDAVSSERAPGALQDVVEHAEVPYLVASPAPPHPALTYERRGALMTGAHDGQTYLIRLSAAKVPGNWFVLQRYVEALPEADAQQTAAWARQGGQIAEAVFAAKLGEFTVPVPPDPALQ